MRISDWSSDVGSSDVYAQGGVEDERRQTDGLIVGVENVVEPRHRPVEIPEEAHARPLPRHARLVPVGLIGRYAEEGAVRVVEGAVRGGQTPRSEERRVGNECGSTWRSRWSTYH